MKFLVATTCIFILLLTSCEKQGADHKPLASSIKVIRDSEPWTGLAAAGSFNTKDSMVSISGTEGVETFTIRFKMPVINERLGSFQAYFHVAPFPYAAAISDSYQLDSTKSNRLRILANDNIKKRIAGTFYIHLKRAERYGDSQTHLFQGKFDVYYQDVSFFNGN